MPGISFFPPSPQDRLTPLPSHISRSFIQTPSGPLELLTASPTSAYTGPRRTPIFFAHGGCGSAGVWLEWMTYLSQQHNITCYAVSYRGRGASWYPWYLRMYFTSARTMAGDLAAGFKFVQDLEREQFGSEKVVLVAHSAGGGLTQLALQRGDVERVDGLALVAASPCFGSIGVNRNWSSMDKWFMPRMFFKHLGHPMSPLSSKFLVKQAFFCKDFTLEKVEAFRRNMPTYESFLWPLGLMFRIADPRIVLNRIARSTTPENRQQRMLVLAGENDRLMSLDLMERQAAEYKAAASKLGDDTVRFEVVKDAGHHLQNDLQWRDGANKLLDWYERL